VVGMRRATYRRADDKEEGVAGRSDAEGVLGTDEGGSCRMS
jgi:hypothetical protein